MEKQKVTIVGNVLPCDSLYQAFLCLIQEAKIFGEKIPRISLRISSEPCEGEWPLEFCASFAWEGRVFVEFCFKQKQSTPHDANPTYSDLRLKGFSHRIFTEEECRPKDGISGLKEMFDQALLLLFYRESMRPIAERELARLAL